MEPVTLIVTALAAGALQAGCRLHDRGSSMSYTTRIAHDHGTGAGRAGDFMALRGK